MRKTNKRLHTAGYILPLLLTISLLMGTGVYSQSDGGGEEKKDESKQEVVDNRPERDRKGPFRLVEPGERVKVILKNETSFLGTVKKITKTEIDLDISYEYMSLTGTLTLDESEVEMVQQLRKRTQKERKQIEEYKKEYRKNLKSNGGKSGSASGESAKKETSKEEKEKEKEKKKKELLSKFPESEWSKERYQNLKNMYGFQRTTREQEFIENWDLIKEARADQETQRQKKLVEEFPPKEGWGEEKYNELKTQRSPWPGKGRMMLNEREKRFLDNFEAWKKGYETIQKEKEQKKKEQEKKQEEAKKSGEKNTGGEKRKASEGESSKKTEEKSSGENSGK